MLPMLPVERFDIALPRSFRFRRPIPLLVSVVGTTGFRGENLCCARREVIALFRSSLSACAEKASVEPKELFRSRCGFGGELVGISWSGRELAVSASGGWSDDVAAPKLVVSAGALDAS